MPVTTRHHQWLAHVFDAVDARDAAGFAAFFADDGRFRFGNAPVVRGRAAIEQAVAGFFASIAALRHELAGVYADGDALVVHGQVTYTRRDGSTLTAPFANLVRVRGDKAVEYLIFVDASALF